jgi:hypothetical protein
MKVANKDCGSFVLNLIPFKGSNLEGAVQSARNSDGGAFQIYIVASYGWYPLLVWKEGVWYGNKERYSVSTSRQLSQATAELSSIQWRSLEELKQLI